MRTRLRLEEQLERFASFPACNPSPVVEVDFAGRVTYQNPAAQRLFPDLEKLGAAHPWVAGLPRLAGTRAAEGEEPQRREVEVAGRTYEQALCLLERRRGFRIYGWDITARKSAEKALARALKRDELLAATASALLAAADPVAAVEKLCRQVLEPIGCHICLHFLGGEAGHALRLNSHTGLTAEQARALEQADCGAAACAGALGDPAGTEAGSLAAASAARGGLLRSWGIAGYACYPIRDAAGAPIGALAFGSRTREGFDEEELSFIRAVADLVAVALARKAAADVILRTNQELEQRVEERTMQLREVTAEMISAEQRERRRLALYLHDHLQQILVGAKLSLGLLGMRVRGARLAAEIRTIEERIGEAINSSRSLTTQLSPPILSSASLAEAFEWLAQRFKEDQGLLVRVRASRGVEPAGTSARLLLFNSVRELLLNVVKHAGVLAAELRVGRMPGSRMRVSVQDRGAGFKTEKAQAPPAAGGFGLLSIRERMERLGGAMELRSAPGRGTRVTLTLPMAPPVAAPEAATRRAPSARRRP